MFCGDETVTRRVISGRVFIPELSNAVDNNAIVRFRFSVRAGV